MNTGIMTENHQQNKDGYRKHETTGINGLAAHTPVAVEKGMEGLTAHIRINRRITLQKKVKIVDILERKENAPQITNAQMIVARSTQEEKTLKMKVEGRTKQETKERANCHPDPNNHDDS